MIRAVGYFTLILTGVVIMGLSYRTEDVTPWWLEMLIFVVGFMILTETIRADERRKHGL